MPTENERKALWFLAIVALSGSGVRLWRAQAREVEVPATMALERQLARADSARDSAGARSAGPRSAGPRSAGRSRRRSPAGATTSESAGASLPVPGSASGPVDLDRADSAAIEALPGIGPALAARIIAHRDSVGSFGVIEALCDVRGIGPGLVERLRPLVTFTGPRRPLSDACGGGSGPSRKATAARRRKPG